jgi:4F5 protein related disordered region
MARGNQRDIDRERAKKRMEANAPGQKKGDFNKRRETDAEIMRRKQEESKRKREEEETIEENKSKKNR